MRKPSRLVKIALRVVLPFSAIIAIVAGSTSPRHSRAQLTFSRFEDVSAVDWIDAPGSSVLFVNITNGGTEPVWFREKVQVQAGGHWNEPVSVRWLCGGPTWPGTGEECVAAVVPRGSEAVRLLVDCRHATSYDAALDLLNRHGLNSRFPALRRWSYWGLANLPQVAGWQRSDYQFVVPVHVTPPGESCGSLHNEVTSSDGGWRVLFALVGQGPAAAEFCRYVIRT
jgi:hypothetical protein